MQQHKPRRLQELSEFHYEKPLALELPYWDLVDDKIVLADGTLVASLALDGISVETWDTDAINRLTTDLRSWLAGLEDGTELTLIADVNSHYSELIQGHANLIPESENSGKNAAKSVADARLTRLREANDSERLLSRELFLLIYLRPELKQKKSESLWKIFFRGPSEFKKVSGEVFEARCQKFADMTAMMAASLGSLGLRSQALSGDGVIRLIHSYLNPNGTRSAPRINRTHESQEFTTDELKIMPSLALSSFREQLCFSDVLISADTIQVGSVHHRMITLKTLPEFSYAAFIAKLTQLPFHHTLSLHIMVPQQSEEISRLQVRRRMAHSMALSHGGRVTDLESEARLTSTEDLLRDLIATGQKIIIGQLAVVLRHRNLSVLDAMTNTTLSRMRELNSAEGLCETLAGFKVWKSNLPFGHMTMVRPKRFKTDNLADFLPIYAGFQGMRDAKPVCLFENRLAGLVSYDPFHAALPNYNALVTGSSGSGKSFLNNLVLLQYMTQKPVVFIIDIGGSYRKLCQFFGGQYIDIAPPRDGDAVKVINPLALPSGCAEPSAQKIKFILAMLENIFAGDEGERLPRLDRALLEETIVSLYANAKARSAEPCMTDLMKILADSKDTALQSYAKMLYPWTGNRSYGRLLDGINAFDIHADLVVFDFKGLSSYPDLQAIMILIITDFILGKVESSAPAMQGRRKQILMDECWELLKSRASSSFMEYCVRTLRKSGSGITFITQGLEEIMASPIGAAMISNTASKFILMQRGDLGPLEKVLKLNKQEIALVGELRQVKGAYSEAFLIAGEERGVVRLVPSPYEYWLATSDANDNAYLEVLKLDFPRLTLPEVIAKAASYYPSGPSGGLRK